MEAEDEKLKAVFVRAEAAALAESRQHTDLVKTVMDDLTVALPVHTGLLGGLVATMVGLVLSGVTLVVTIPNLVVAVGALALVVWRARRKHLGFQRVFVSASESYWGLLHQGELLSRVTQRAQARLKWTLALNVIIQKAHRLIEQARAKGAASEDDLRGFCTEILEVMKSDRHLCLRFTGADQTYNFHVFRWNAATRKLEGFARVNGSQVQVHNRVWDSGQGHVGSCFEANEALMLDDLHGTAGVGYLKQKLALDSQLYRAIMDAPIPGKGAPWGVLVVTSGRAGQFEPDDLTPVSLVSGILGTVFAVTA